MRVKQIKSRRSRNFGVGLRLGLSSFLIAGSLLADIYQHVDENGVIHLQNRKRQGKLVARESPGAVVMPAAVAYDSGRFDEHIREAAVLYQIPEALIRAVIKVESNFDPRAVSPANAHGLMQLLPETAARMMVTDIFDPRQNILGGVRYLRVLANLFNGNLELTLAGYNAGENAVLQYGGIPPYAETQYYVVKVLAAYEQYRRATPAVRN
jgi:soluble lytic murein transglycosylase-like protein